MIEPTFIKQLYHDVQMAFDQSDIKQYALERDMVWNYAIAATYLKKHSNLIVGFNWGVTKGESYETQKSIPADSFKDLYDKNYLGSLQRIYQPLQRYFPEKEVAQFIQTNFCFFRSETESQISSHDLQLSKPLFDQLLNGLEPQGIFCFSSKLRDHLMGKASFQGLQEASFKSNQRTLYVAKGEYATGLQRIPIYFLPHPNAKFTSEARKLAWDFCFG